jgi:small GTP-binding protein
MPMPHRTFAEVAKRRLVGKEGSERIAMIRALLGELPGYRNGPYADLRKWLEGELDRTRVRGKVLHRDSLQVRREGAAQVALVGPPNAGKSSLLQALSDIQIKTGDYAFTTLRPVPALTRVGGVLVQLVEIPGLIEGAHEDRGGGRALLGVLRNADAIVYCRAANDTSDAFDAVRTEVAAAGIEKPSLVALTKSDEIADLSSAGASVAGTEPCNDQSQASVVVVPVSVLDDASLDRLREAIWKLTGLIRVFPRRGDEVDDEPFALPVGANVADVADQVHHHLAESCTGARIWGVSARFDGQRVGRGHVLADGDVVEVLRR